MATRFCFLKQLPFGQGDGENPACPLMTHLVRLPGAAAAWFLPFPSQDAEFFSAFSPDLSIMSNSCHNPPLERLLASKRWSESILGWKTHHTTAALLFCWRLSGPAPGQAGRPALACAQVANNGSHTLLKAERWLCNCFAFRMKDFLHQHFPSY